MLVSRELFHHILGIRVVGDEELVVVTVEQVGVLKRVLDLGQVGSVDCHLRLFAKPVSARSSRNGGRAGVMTYKRELIMHTEHVLHAKELARVLLSFVLNSREETTLGARVVCKRDTPRQYRLLGAFGNGQGAHIRERRSRACTAAGCR